jgi:hypothetical protein
MIHLKPLPLPEPQAKAIKEWLNLPAARLFRDTLAQMAMASAAEGANSAMDLRNPDNAKVESEEYFAKAITANNMLELMHNMLDPKFEYKHFEIGPKPTTTPLIEDMEQ